jgi:predicted transcriptional regulator
MVWASFPSFFQILSAFKYRDRMAIVSDILKTLKDSRGGKKKTQIMQSANLNYIQLDKYMRYLLHCGFLKIRDNGKIDITDEGAKFLLFLQVQKIPAVF